MSIIKHLRSWHFKKEKKFTNFPKVVAIIYILVLMLNFLVSDTTASFNDVEVIENSLHTKWDPPEVEWDKSSLDFTNIEVDENCEVITATLKNGLDSEDALGPIYYQIRWAEKGPAWDGKIKKEDSVESLSSGDSVELNVSVDKPGKYRFTAFQHPEHPGKGITSIDIEVKECNQPVNSTAEEEATDLSEDEIDEEAPEKKDEKDTKQSTANDEKDKTSEEKDENASDNNEEDKTEEKEEQKVEEDEEISSPDKKQEKEDIEAGEKQKKEKTANEDKKANETSDNSDEKETDDESQSENIN